VWKLGLGEWLAKVELGRLSWSTTWDIWKPRLGRGQSLDLETGEGDVDLVGADLVVGKLQA